MNLKLNTAEIETLQTLFNQIVIKRRTGEFGIMHGMDRFVSTNKTFRKQHIDTLDSIVSKLGMNEIKKI